MDFNNNKPIYRQIIDYCYNCILSEMWTPDNKIPSVREMASRMAVNTHTVLKAYDFMQAAEIIFMRRGMGYFLASDALLRVNEARREEFFTETVPALSAEMKMLGISIEELLQHMD